MGRKITVAAAQTGPVLSEDMRPAAQAACGMIEEAAAKGVEIVCFPEVFLTPFFPAQLRQDYEHFFLELPSPITEPFLGLAREKGIAVIFGFGERAGGYFYISAAIFDRDVSRQLKIGRF